MGCFKRQLVWQKMRWAEFEMGQAIHVALCSTTVPQTVVPVAWGWVRGLRGKGPHSKHFLHLVAEGRKVSQWSHQSLRATGPEGASVNKTRKRCH